MQSLLLLLYTRGIPLVKARKRKERRRGGRISKRYDDNDEDRIKAPTNNWLADKSVGKIAGEGKASEQRAYEIQRLL